MRLLTILLVTAILLLGSVMLQGCSQNSQEMATNTPDGDSPSLDEEEAIGVLNEYFLEPYESNPYCWAYPIFPTSRWSATYRYQEGIWLVKAYNTDGSYAGTWVIPDIDGEIEPYDERAITLSLENNGIAVAPPLPGFTKYPYAIDPDDPDKCMIAAVETRIVNMTPQEVAEFHSFSVIQQLIRTHYPLDWHISFTEEWHVGAYYYEDAVVAYIERNTDRIVVFDHSGALGLP